MKKTILLLLVFFVTIPVFGQVKQTVLGIETNTTMKVFKAALEKKGYKPTQTVAGRYVYEVQYAGYQKCKMQVAFNNGNDSVTFIDIYLPHESYSKDLDVFSNMASQLKEKYGNERSYNFTGRVNYYGDKKQGTQCILSLYQGRSDSEDGVVVEYVTKAIIKNEVVVSDDI